MIRNSASVRQELLRKIPPVDKILEGEEIAPLLKRYGRNVVLKAVHKYLNGIRQKIMTIEEDQLLEAMKSSVVTIQGYDIEQNIALFFEPLLKRVINATGVILHTNLGRSVLPDEAVVHMITIARSYSNLEYDLQKGERGSRYQHVRELLCQLTGAESALVVNNNAAAILLALNTLANGREAIVSRGEIIEIGGSFRIPDIMSRSGACMVEVGTTNKTHISDYENAICERSAVIIKVHTSNYRVLGFTSQVDVPSLISLAKRHKLPVIADLGSGSLIDLSRYGLTYEPTVQNMVASGIDVVTFSGDKLLGGPQAGLIVGKKDVVDRLMKNPLNRALRIDKLTLAALETTLRLYIDEVSVTQRVPTLRMITATVDAIEQRARSLIERLRPLLPSDIVIGLAEDSSQVGGGALPLQHLPTRVITVSSSAVPVELAERRMRTGQPPIVARIQRDQLLIDLRTVAENEEDDLVAALTRCYADAPL